MDQEFRSRQIYTSRQGSSYTVEFHLPKEALVTLTLINPHGKIIEQIIESARYSAGRHQIEFDRSKCNGNSCFYRLAMQTAEREIVDTKMIYMQMPQE